MAGARGPGCRPVLITKMGKFGGVRIRLRTAEFRRFVELDPFGHRAERVTGRPQADDAGNP